MRILDSLLAQPSRQLMGAQDALLLSNAFKGKEKGPDFVGFHVSFSFPFIPALLKVCRVGLWFLPELCLHPKPWFLGIAALFQKRVFADAVMSRISR